MNLSWKKNMFDTKALLALDACWFDKSYMCCCLHDEADEELFLEDQLPVETKGDVDNDSYNDLLLKRLQNSLSGVPPPPMLTFPQQKVEEILDIWKNSSIMTISNDKTESNQNLSKMNCSFQKALDSRWPEVKNCSFFDITYNLGELSEKIVDLYDKYRERFVGCETSSFIRPNNSAVDFLNKKKDRRKIGSSSARRLSHLTKRRAAFSSESLKAVNNYKILGGLRKKTILVDSNKDKKDKIVKRALFHTPDEIKNKTEIKGSSSELKAMQLKHSVWLRKRTPVKGTPRKTPNKQGTPRKTPTKHGTPRKTPNKQTPTKRTPKKLGTPKKTDVTFGVNSRICKTFIGEAYQTAKSENGKRLRLDIDVDDNAMDGTSSIKSDGNISELSETQRKKLLWAVSAALKKVGVSCSHRNFRAYGKRLYRICKEFWINRTSNSTLKSGITERMLSLASENVKSVIEEVQRIQTNNIESFTQDSNSCDVFFSKNFPNES